MFNQGKLCQPYTATSFEHLYSGINPTTLTSSLSSLYFLSVQSSRVDATTRNTTKSESKYYIREIKNLFVVGQTYPVTEVPGPHSRKITNTIKHRLQIIAYKLLAKSPGERLKISRLMKYFPDQNELQMRQRLKASLPFSCCTPVLKDV